MKLPSRWRGWCVPDPEGGFANQRRRSFGEGLVALPGGNVVKDAAGEIIGAVGISGLAAHEDQVIADAVA